ncbi:MAG: metallophosphoesterase [Hyphomicrobiales bacterium]|nr:metallophosphoesterase [Hyphomicrobiales bacterium]
MIIAQISDTHLLANGSDADARDRRIGNFERTVAHIRGLAPQPDVVLHTGDISQNATGQEYGLAREILSGLKSPVLAIVGNRDRRAPFAAAFAGDGYLRSGAGFVQYAVALNGLRLVAADTIDEATPMGGFCDDRLAELDAMLCEAPDMPTLLFLHHPPKAIPAVPKPHQFEPDEATRLRALIGRHEQIVRVLCGHTHRADQVDVGRVPLSTVPSIATDLRKDRYPDALADTPVYQLHEVGEDGTVVSRTCTVSASREDDE